MNSAAPTDDARFAPDTYGIHAWWTDSHGTAHQVAPETVSRFREAIGTPPEAWEQVAPLVVRRGESTGHGTLDVECEDGIVRSFADVVPDDFPFGYHWIRDTAGARRRLVVSPGRCWLPEARRAWGWTVQLYAVRSGSSWGIGDLRDLREIRVWSQSVGAGFLLVNPLHAVGPAYPQEASPYLPASRQFRNPIYICVPEAPGAGSADLASIDEAGRELNETELIDRDKVWALKDRALREVHALGADIEAFATWRSERGAPLAQYAAWCALSLEHGADWHSWPSAFQDPGSEAVRRFTTERAEEITYQAWLQWVVDQQLRAATGDLVVIQDLPVGVSGGGSDAWADQGLIPDDVHIGAPPDAFNAAGQDWGSPPLVPWRLRARDYEPLVRAVRATISGAGGLRIDHVMGLFRLWWVPADSSPTDGAYIRYPSRELLDIVALESHRARAIVVGEDLGTVEAGVREELAARALLSYRLLVFEKPDPEHWPTSALAAVSTHDLPTIAGLWTGSDVDEQVDIGVRRENALASQERMREMLRTGLAPTATVEEAIEAAHEQLARTPSMLVSATLEDAVAEQRRPNIPGAMNRPNWCIPLSVTLEELMQHPGPGRIAAALARRLTPAG